MLSTEERIRQIFFSAVNEDRLSPRARDLFSELQGFTMADLGINSVDAQGLLKKVEDEFGVEISGDTAAGFGSVQDLTDYLDSRS